ncbi:MAG: DNA-binding response regulator [Sinobacteraceae bacterium]|nr:DNA-binding response regulator [Nevskiaceae bacterium]
MLSNPLINDRATEAEAMVLLIDANAASLEFMARALSQRGTHVLTGDGGGGVEATLELLRGQPQVGVLVIDPTSLVGYSGSQTPDFVQRAAAVRQDLQVILVAEPPEFSRFTDTLVLEVADLLPKPLARGTLLRAVFEAQRRHASNRERQGESVVVRMPERPGLPRRQPARDISPDLRTLQLLADIDEFRCSALGDVFEADATWSMLSELLRAQLLRRQISVTSLCLASRSPVTTALRRIERLQAAGLVSFNLDPKDRRRKYIELTAAGSARVTEVIRGVARRLGDESPGP